MKPVKSLFLRTYGRQGRKVSAWISPENHKRAFDSSLSTDGDVSVFEPPKSRGVRQKRASVARHNVGQQSKRKSVRCLIEKSCDEENVIVASFHPEAAQHSKTTREKTIRACTRMPVRSAKRKAALHLTEYSSDEENISCPSPARPQPAQQKKTARERQLKSVSGALGRKRDRRVAVASGSDGDLMAVKTHKNSAQNKSSSNAHQRSVGAFVTFRPRRAVAKPELQKAIISILNSSDDFTSAASGLSCNLQPSRKRKVPPSFLESSAENSVTCFEPCMPLREISLDELTDHTLGPYSGNPIFCSTPSAGAFGKRPGLKPFSINDKLASPPSITAGSTCVLSPFQENQDSQGQPGSPPLSALPAGHSDSKLKLHAGEQDPHLRHQKEQSGDLLLDDKSTNKSKESKRQSEDSKTQNSRELPSLILLSSAGESTGDFVSAAAGLEWLIEAVKDQCLTFPCTVQLHRLDSLFVAELCNQTTYSSCLGLSSLGLTQPTNEHPSSEGVFQTTSSKDSSTTRDKTRDLSNIFGCTRQSHSTSDHSASAAESAHRTETSPDSIMGPHLGNTDQCLVKKCSVPLKKLDLSQFTVHYLKTLEKQKDMHLSVDPHGSKSVNAESDDTLETENPEVLTCSRESTQGMMVSGSCSINDSDPVAHAQSREPQSAAVHTAMLEERCLSAKLTVGIKKMTLSQLKGAKRQRVSTVRHSDSTGDEQRANDHQCDSDVNLCRDDASLKVIGKKQTLTSSENKDVSNDSCHFLRKRKTMSRMPKEKKRRSTSTDRPVTARKACVSGLSVTRWKNKSVRPWAGDAKTVDCSINELTTGKHKQPKEFGRILNFSSPVRTGDHNLSSLLADLTPNTHMWSRLKAALSVHRKVILTPSSRLSGTPVRSALADVSHDLFATPFRTLLPKHLQSQLNHDSMQECEDTDLSDAEKVYAECAQKQPLAWEECILPHRMKRCVKIGEGTFGEVFSTTNSSGETVALKIIPVEGSEKVNGEDQKTFGEILHEIIISKELSSLKEQRQNQTCGFIGLDDLHCVRGPYPTDFLKAWDKFDQKKGSENDRPDFFEEDQLFLILEFEFGGADLENSNGTLASLGVARSILHQVTAALAVAEQALQFEHRDLHWGNILVKPTKQRTGSFLLNGATHTMETRGVLVRVIDYSLSRLEIDGLTVSCDISEDEDLFMGQGDYQFDIYRLMREENGNNWSDYHPHTNVLWLHYLCSKLLSMKFRSTGGRGVKDIREELARFYDDVLQYSSATDVLKNCPMFQ